MSFLDVFVSGAPLPKGSPSIVPGGPGRPPRVHESGRCKTWQRQVAQVCQKAMLDRPLLDEPIHLSLHFVLEPQKTKVRADTKPDIDKLARAVLDAMEGTVYVNDSRVIALFAAKRRGDRVGVEIHVETPSAYQ